MKCDRDIYNRLKEISNLQPWNQPTKLEEFVNELEPRSVRSSSQNNSLHLWMKHLAEEMNIQGKDMKLVLKDDVDIWWTTESVKENILKPVMKAMTGKTSTTELDKTNGEIDKIHEQIMKWLGEKHGIEYIPFPSLKEGEQLHGKTKINN